MTTQPSFHQCLTAWKFSVVGKEKAAQWPAEITADSIEQFSLWQKELLATKIEAGKHGHACQFNKGGTSSGRMAAWIVANGYTLKIVYTAGKRRQAVTQTSREAYKTVDLGERCEAVARAAIKLGVCTDREVARAIGMDASSVSARRNDIEQALGITIDGVHYMVRVEGSRVDAVTRRRGNTWALVGVSGGVEAAQTELFK